jgi:hypothetical protein
MNHARLLRALNDGRLSGERGVGCWFAASDPSIIGTISIFRRRLPDQSEFSVLKSNLMAVPCIVAIFLVSARVQLDDPISSAAGLQPRGGEQSMRASRKTRNRTMKMKYFLAALLLVPSLAEPAMVQARTQDSSIPPRAIEGREVAAPSWSAACMTDHGPSQCEEPMWVYGSPARIARYKNAF